MIIGQYLIRRDMIRDYFTDYNIMSIKLWKNYKKYGWPYVGGWAQQPSFVYDVIETIESEMEAIQAEKAALAKGKK